jgi:hypothetical protein
MRTIESDTQQGCVKWFRLAYPKLSKLLFSVPNGGFRNIMTAKRMVAEGVVAGVSDLILFYPSKGKHALCIEMKTKQGKQSEKQKQWQIAVENFGYKYIICHSFDEFKAEIQKYIN